MNDVTFCFIVTKDLVKEQIWRQWLARLAALDFKFKVVTHVSPEQKGNITSDWLKTTLIPDAHLCATGWGWIMSAMLALYRYATAQAPAAWYSLHSESCVPFVSPEKFIENYKQFKHKTFLSYCKAWWDPARVRRANLHLLPTELHWAHPNWCILCHDDLSQMLTLAATDKRLTTILKTGHMAEESFIAVFLYQINNFKNVINKSITLADWKRTPNGNNPYTFADWTAADQQAVAELCAEKEKNEFMFLRKVGAAFPDAVLLNLIGL